MAATLSRGVLLIGIVLQLLPSSSAFNIQKLQAAVKSGNIQNVHLVPGGLKAVIQGKSVTEEQGLEDVPIQADEVEVPDELLKVPSDSLPFDNFGPPGSAACFDFVLVLDVSCSILLSMRERARDFAVNLVSKLAGAPGADIKFGLMLFSHGTQDIFYLDEGLGADELVETIRNTDVNGECKSHLHTALKQLNETFFTTERGDRDNGRYPNVAAIFTDGRTAQFKYNKDTLLEADNVKKAGIDINIVATPHRSGRPDTGEFAALPSEPYEDHFFKIENEDDELRIFESLTSRYSCRGAHDQTVCADILFAFDTSCSLDAGNISAAVAIAQGITQNLALDAERGSMISAFSYNREVIDSFKFSSAEPDGNPARVVDMLSKLKVTRVSDEDCRTRNDIAFNKTIAELSLPNDRDDQIYSDIAVFFGDGMSSPLNKRPGVIKAAKAIRDNGGAVVWVVLTSNRGLAKINDGIENEIKNVVSEDLLTGEKFIFYHDDPFVSQRIVGLLDQFASCRV